MTNKATTSAGIDEKWEAENDVRTLITAAEIKKDSKRWKRAMTMAKKQLTDLKGLSNG